MTVEHKAVNFEDARGTITDIFVNSPKDHATIIFSKKGAVRGNHYHKLSTQHDFIVSGSMRALTQKVGETEINETILGPYDYATYEPGEAHGFVMLEDTVFITFVTGVRGGEDYEKDTYRLETPIATS